MKFRKFGQASLAAVVSFGVAAGISACGGTSRTIDYVYVTNSKSSPGQINAYYTDSKSGALTQIPGSPFPSGGTNPVALVAAPNFQNIYVVNDGVGGSGGAGIVQFTIGSDATIKAQATTAPPAPLSVPNAVAINSAGTLLFVTYKFIGGANSSGAVVVYPISSSGTLGTPVANGSLPYFPLTTGTSNVVSPVGLTAVTQNPVNSTTAGPSLLYVANTDTESTGSSASTLGSITAFSVATNGTLTLVPGPQADGTFAAGTTPSAIASTPRGLFLYVTDSANNQLISYTIQSTGQIIPSPNGPTRTDVFPDSIVIDPRGQFIYVANYTGNDISAYTINTATGYPTGVAAAGTYATGTGPTCVFVEPALGRYVYTTNFLDNTVSGLLLDPNAGTLSGVENSPFVAAGQPTCITATPHGNHPLSTPTT